MKYNAICLSVVLGLVLSLAPMPAVTGVSKAEAMSANLIVNGSFESGITGFIQDYTYR